MAETTNIEWADATLNFWIGCTKVSVACDNCYAEAWAARWPAFRNTWGPHAARVKTKNPLAKAKAIIREAKKRGIARPFIFSNSLSDIMDNQVPIEWLAEALQIMAATPEAIYLLLTKRPGQIVDRIQAALDLLGWDEMPDNIAFGMTVVTQAELNRDWRKLRDARAELQPAFLFLSIEPIQEAIDLARGGAIYWNQGGVDTAGDFHEPEISRIDSVDWVIVGGESGPHARDSDPEWFRSALAQCAQAEIAFLMKQMARKGEIPNDLMVRQRPAVRA